jgi:Nickel/cobalt transporter regulator
MALSIQATGYLRLGGFGVMLMRKTLLSVLMATAFVSPVLSVAAYAQDVQVAQNEAREGGAWQRRFGGGSRGGDQPQRQREVRQEQRQEQRQQQPRVEQPRFEQPRADVRQDVRVDRRDGGGRDNRGIVTAAPVQQQAQNNRNDRGGNWQRGDRPVSRGPFSEVLRGDNNRGDRGIRGDQNRDARFDRNQDGRVDRDWDRNRNGVVDRRFDRNRDGNLDRNYDRNRDGNIDRRYDRNQNGRVDQRYGQNDRNWNRNWRGDNRYNWQSHRNQYRSYYNQPRYYNPYGNGYGYQRFSVGIYLNSLFFSSRYWINDPYEYRLPQAPYGYRWVRYYDDVILVDQRNGYVVDVIHNFFW